MSYYQKYKNKPRYKYASAPTLSVHAPAQYQESELVPPSGWYGDPSPSFPSNQHVQADAPTVQRTPNNFGNTQGYYRNGCWYNARLEKHATAGVMVQPPPASPPQQHHNHNHHHQQQQQHAPQYYLAAQPGQEQHMASAYPLQRQHMTSSHQQQPHQLHPMQQQPHQLHAMQQQPHQLYPMQQQQHQLYSMQQQPQQLHAMQQQQSAMVPTIPYQQRQQQQMWAQSYPSQQQQQQMLPQSCESQVVVAPAYPLQHQQQQQPHLVLVPTHPSQGQQQHHILLQPCAYHQQRQIVPHPTYQSQQPMSPSAASQQQQIHLSAQYHQIPFSVHQQQLQAMSSLPGQQYREVFTVSPSPRAPDVVATPQAMLTAPTMRVPLQIEMESPQNQEMPEPYVVTEAEGGPQEATQNPFDVLDMNMGPGVQATRSHNKLTIDIDLSHVDKGVLERRRSVDDVMKELVWLIRGCVFRNPLPQRPRNRYRHRHTVARARPVSDGVQHVLVADKETQTVAASEVVPSQLEFPESVQESPSSSTTSVKAELLSEPSATTLARIFHQEELCIDQPKAVDLICDQVSQSLTDLKQSMATGLDTLDKKMAKMSTQAEVSPHREPKVEATTPLLIPQPKKAMDEASSWPPLGTRASTKARLFKKSISLNAKGSFFKPSQRFNENKSSRPYFGTQRQVRSNSNDSATFQPKQILQNLERYGEDLAKSNGDRAEPAVQKVPAGNLNGNSQSLKASQNISLSSANDKKLPSRRQGNGANGLQDKKNSFQSFKLKQPESKSIAGNMFALLEEPGAEPPPAEIKAEAAGEEKDQVDVQKLVAKKAKKLKRKLKKKEKTRASRLEAKEENVKFQASPPGNTAGLVGKSCEIHILGKLQVTSLPVIEKEEKPLQILQFRNAEAEKTSNETSAEAKPAEAGDPTQPVLIPVESREEFSSLGAKRGRRRSVFLNAVAEYAVSKKSAEENKLPAKRNLWEKRRQTDQPGQPES